MALLETISTKGLEAFHSATTRRSLRSRCHDKPGVLRCVPVHRNDVIWCPAHRATTASADELELLAQCIGAIELGALLAIWFVAELSRAGLRQVLRLFWARSHETGTLWVFEKLERRIWLWLPG